MQDILHSRYYNLGEGKVGRYLVKMRLQANYPAVFMLSLMPFMNYSFKCLSCSL